MTYIFDIRLSVIRQEVGCTYADSWTSAGAMVRFRI